MATLEGLGILDMQMGAKGPMVLAHVKARGRMQVVQLLLSRGAAPGLRDTRGRTALMRAEAKRQGPIAQLLRSLQ